MTPLQALRAVIRMWTDDNHRNEALWCSGWAPLL